MRRGEKAINRSFVVDRKSLLKTSKNLKEEGSKLSRNFSPSREPVRKGSIFQVIKKERKEERKKLGI